jgi:hypothetical protein
MITKITNGVFIAQFFNTAILILLVNANFEDSGWLPPFMRLSGPFLDYSDEWYATVGYAITQTMLINCFTPIITEVIVIALTRLTRWSDQKFTWDKKTAMMTTKCS